MTTARNCLFSPVSGATYRHLRVIGSVSSPSVEFITNREHALSPERMAHRRTGRNIRTGELTLGVSMRNRHNGTVRIEADLIRLPYGLTADAIERLQSHWDAITPLKMQARMQHHFGCTFIQFDTMTEHANDWRELLAMVLSDWQSYATDKRMN